MQHADETGAPGLIARWKQAWRVPPMFLAERS
jgi:hypothetical protein